MPTEISIACSLTADELPARMAAMASIGDAALDSAEVTGARAVLRFRPASGTRERLAAIVAAEARCCAFLRMDLDDAPDGLVLTVEAPDGAGPVLAELVAAFHGQDAVA